MPNVCPWVGLSSQSALHPSTQVFRKQLWSLSAGHLVGQRVHQQYIFPTEEDTHGVGVISALGWAQKLESEQLLKFSLFYLLSLSLNLHLFPIKWGQTFNSQRKF